MGTSAVIAVVVTYHPDTAFAARLASYASQVTETIIVDNSTEESAQKAVAAIVENTPNCTLIVNGNAGKLARAQNIGIQAALAHGAEWVVLFDDDSTASTCMIGHMLTVWQCHPDRERIALLAPILVDEATGHEHCFIIANGWRIARKLMNDAPCLENLLTANASGSLIRADALRNIGLMREDYAMDWLDIEYSLRLQKRKYKLLAVGCTRLLHNLGNKTRHLGITTTNHSVSRRYSMMRNRVDCWKRYAYHFPSYIAYDMLVACYELLKIMLLEQQKTEKISGFLRGMLHGLLGRFDKSC